MQQQINTPWKFKKLMNEAADGKKVVRHDGHKLENGKTGMDHFQKKSGEGSHIFYSATAVVTEKILPSIPGMLLGTTLTEAVGKSTGLNNAGKNIFGNNAVGRFIDNWINPLN